MKAKQLINLNLTLLMLTGPVFAQSGKVAVIDTDAFIQPQKGITRLVRALESVEREFEPRRAELSGMHERLAQETEKFSFAGPIPTDPRPMTPERRRELKEKAEAMRRAIERHEAEMQLAHSRRSKEATAPILKDIRDSLESFAKARGITVLLDAGKSACLVGCDSESSAALDVTQEFIAEYNRLHP